MLSLVCRYSAAAAGGVLRTRGSRADRPSPPLFCPSHPSSTRLPQKVKAHLLETIASDPGLQQTELVFLGLFGRACRVLEGAGGAELEEARKEAASLVELLDLRQGSLAATLDGGFPELRSTGKSSRATAW